MKFLISMLFVLWQTLLQAQSKPFVPLEYEYPASILSTAKTYVYKNTITSGYRYKDISRTDKQGNVIIIWKEYDSSPLVDSSTEINDKTIDHYLIINGKKIKGVTIEDSVYNNGSPLGEKIQSGSFTLNPSMIFSFTFKSRFLKDTVLQWKGKNIACIIIESNSRQVAENPSEPSLKKEMNGRTIYFFGKDIGLIKYTSTGEYGLTDWELQEIKEKPNQ